MPLGRKHFRRSRDAPLGNTQSIGLNTLYSDAQTFYPIQSFRPHENTHVYLAKVKRVRSLSREIPAAGNIERRPSRHHPLWIDKLSGVKISHAPEVPTYVAADRATSGEFCINPTTRSSSCEAAISS